jgi:cell division transport system permease protein
MILTLALGLVTRSWRASPTGDQIEALFGAFTISWRGYAVVILIALFVALITGIVSRLTVRRFLNENG